MLGTIHRDKGRSLFVFCQDKVYAQNNKSFIPVEQTSSFERQTTEREKDDKQKRISSVYDEIQMLMCFNKFRLYL